MTEPKQAEEPKKERRLGRETEVAAPFEEVWKALTEARSWLHGIPAKLA